MKNPKKTVIDPKAASILRPLSCAVFLLLGAGEVYFLIAGGFHPGAGAFLAALAAVLMLAAGVAGLLPRRGKFARVCAFSLLAALALRFVLKIVDGGDLDVLLLAEAALAWLLTVCL